MVTSMTGYGKGSASAGGGEITAEIRTLNHRFIDCSIRLPRALNGFECEIERAVKKRLTRGQVYVTVTFGRSGEANALVLNRDLLRRTWREVSAFAKREGISGGVDVGSLLALPDMFRPEVDTIAPGRLAKALAKALDAALDGCIAMRRREGRILLGDIRRRIARIERIAARIEKRAPRALEEAKRRSRARIEGLIGGDAIRDERWEIEAAIIADKTDFSEEIVRLGSHLKQAATVLGAGGEIGKKMTFLLQEIHRESTTMGNKATDPVVIRDCLAVKEEVEKIREQVQNLE